MERVCPGDGLGVKDNCCCRMSAGGTKERTSPSPTIDRRGLSPSPARPPRAAAADLPAPAPHAGDGCDRPRTSRCLILVGRSIWWCWEVRWDSRRLVPSSLFSKSGTKAVAPTSGGPLRLPSPFPAGTWTPRGVSPLFANKTSAVNHCQCGAFCRLEALESAPAWGRGTGPRLGGDFPVQ